ncbi:PREDICTED: lysophosphatidic acid receptor 3-like [Acropora digitifera]|uniref:lysophosphatidic acid receptor 3-like n=1 Tax=Acropora digitifera TaxID=70779 RepID=UPI00077A3E77|nr:PREDICTED: lysophosphatidic acid receptor 3-like [Acropora digitifera]XP_015747834.1 PREDICTED: lysophosphatidic acid receptor 3-like [Acropora digitifera]XP_015747835.1 PREDICTED: lysophosphatidic acid receptor 3-like [Acropora digitifera]
MANHSQEQHEASSVTPFSASGCIAFLTVYGIEVVAIVTLNALTIIVYLKERSLRKRSMYLMINQAVADMFFGASLIYDYLLCAGDICEVWTINLPRHLHFIIVVLWIVSPLASLINLGAISLERMHATFRPFKHRLIKRKIFGAAAAIVWITAGAISTVIVPQFDFKSPFSKRIFYIVFYSSFLFCLLTITVSYLSIAMKIVYGTQSHHRSATSGGRKLTKTLFIVTVVSLLLTLPLIIIMFCKILQLCTSIPFYLHFSFHIMFYANSLVNPVLYTFRIPEFKRALVSFLYCRSQRQPAPGFPLNEM